MSCNCYSSVTLTRGDVCECVLIYFFSIASQEILAVLVVQVSLNSEVLLGGNTLSMWSM